ncbi:MAG: gamma-glutamyltransferase, partial [Cyanobacteria bacterium P01_E01_bin.43]
MIRRRGLPWAIAGFSTGLLILLSLIWPMAGRSQVSHVATGKGGAVASVDHRATQVGIDVLKTGGNAVDAAVATAAALGV